MKFPSEWLQGSRYYFTYYGDVYYGIAVPHDDLPDGLFIIQNANWKTYQALKDRSIESVRKLGWEIKDYEVIVKASTGDANNKLGGENPNNHMSRSGGAKYKRMFLFGAGASAFCTFGSEKTVLRHSKLRPPIGYEIFDEDYNAYCEKYPGVRLSIPGYEAAGRDIEAYLEKEWRQIKDKYNPSLLRRHISVQYYLQELFSNISRHVLTDFNRKNLYSIFADKLQQYDPPNSKEKFALVSFNYDTILDGFIEQIFDHPFKKMHDYVNFDSPFLFFKPHGSANWEWPFYRGVHVFKESHIPTYLYENTVDLNHLYFNLLGDYKKNLAENSWGLESALHPNRLGRYTLNKNRIEVMQPSKKYYPSLLLPYNDKDEFVMHYDHQERLMHISEEVEELYLIGWKGSEDVFNRMMNANAHRLKKIVIVNPNEEKNQEVSKELLNYQKYSNCEIEVIKDFEDFVLNKLDNILQS